MEHGITCRAGRIEMEEIEDKVRLNICILAHTKLQSLEVKKVSHPRRAKMSKHSIFFN